MAVSPIISDMNINKNIKRQNKNPKLLINLPESTKTQD